jgi:hypothetical protein
MSEHESDRLYHQALATLKTGDRAGALALLSKAAHVYPAN